MDSHACLNGSVHCDSKAFAHLSEWEDIGQQVQIIPYSSKIFDLTDESQNLLATIGEDLEWHVALANSSK